MLLLISVPLAGDSAPVIPAQTNSTAENVQREIFARLPGTSNPGNNRAQYIGASSPL